MRDEEKGWSCRKGRLERQSVFLGLEYSESEFAKARGVHQ